MLAMLSVAHGDGKRAPDNALLVFDEVDAGIGGHTARAVGEHLRALEGVSRCLKDKNFVRALRQASTPQQIWDLIANHDRGA